MYRIMHKKRVPERLHNCATSWVCETGNVTVSSLKYAKGRTPLEILTGETPDTTEYLDFGFYDWVSLLIRLVSNYQLKTKHGELSQTGQLEDYGLL